MHYIALPQVIDSSRGLLLKLDLFLIMCSYIKTSLRCIKKLNLEKTY